MFCVSKSVAAGTETLSFGEKVIIRHIIWAAPVAAVDLTIIFDASGNFPFTTTWQTMRLQSRVQLNGSVVIQDVNLICRIAIITAVNTSYINFLYDYVNKRRKKKKEK